jgi:hypothetical protein
MPRTRVALDAADNITLDTRQPALRCDSAQRRSDRNAHDACGAIVDVDIDLPERWSTEREDLLLDGQLRGTSRLSSDSLNALQIPLDFWFEHHESQQRNRYKPHTRNARHSEQDETDGDQHNQGRQHAQPPAPDRQHFQVTFDHVRADCSPDAGRMARASSRETPTVTVSATAYSTRFHGVAARWPVIHAI